MRYAGQMYDNESGLYYLRARYYDPNVGRFISEDTDKGKIENPSSLNLYVYCQGNPIRLVDPSGHVGVTIESFLMNNFYQQSTGGKIDNKIAAWRWIKDNNVDVVVDLGTSVVYKGVEGWKTAPPVVQYQLVGAGFGVLDGIVDYFTGPGLGIAADNQIKEYTEMKEKLGDNDKWYMVKAADRVKVVEALTNLKNDYAVKVTQLEGYINQAKNGVYVNYANKTTYSIKQIQERISEYKIIMNDIDIIIDINNRN